MPIRADTSIKGAYLNCQTTPTDPGAGTRNPGRFKGTHSPQGVATWSVHGGWDPWF